ncbi:hypothetical protein GCM10007888_48870 [Methylobacterium oxalidis]|uniref:Glycosyl transferase family 1 domain-containing protein n=1 Tax=Methylobacterium oxalidis TaxID=944322 RepID=A0ABQ6DQY1_9HYPH|nr:hypothetical protein GCM10007888_48870 [Methylobacterium oxalidis]
MFRGVYDPQSVISHMQTCGWVVVPSVWWENSPIVIQEAFAAGRPVLCSGIGGMREAVEHGRDGFYFRPDDPLDLSNTFERCLAGPQTWSNLRANIKAPRTIEIMNAEYVKIYSDILG